MAAKLKRIGSEWVCKAALHKTEEIW